MFSSRVSNYCLTECGAPSYDVASLLQGSHTVALPVVVVATNKTVGAIESTFRNALSICVTDQLAPGTFIWHSV